MGLVLTHPAPRSASERLHARAAVPPVAGRRSPVAGCRTRNGHRHAATSLALPIGFMRPVRHRSARRPPEPGRRTFPEPHPPENAPRPDSPVRESDCRRPLSLDEAEKMQRQRFRGHFHGGISIYHPYILWLNPFYAHDRSDKDIKKSRPAGTALFCVIPTIRKICFCCKCQTPPPGAARCP